MYLLHWAPLACLVALSLLLLPHITGTADLHGANATRIGNHTWLHHRLTDDECCKRREDSLWGFLQFCNHADIKGIFFPLAVSIAFWYVLAIIFRHIGNAVAPKGLSLRDRMRIGNSLLNVTHATLATIAAGTILYEDSFMWRQLAYYSSPWATMSLLGSVGYFFVDILEMVRMSKKAGGSYNVYFAHHISCFIGILYTVAYRIGVSFAVALQFSEASTPFLHLRTLLPLVFGLSKRHPICQANAVLFLVSFILVRNFSTFAQVIWLVTQPNQWSHLPWFVFVGFIFLFALTVLNAWWLPQVWRSVGTVELGRGPLDEDGGRKRRASKRTK